MANGFLWKLFKKDKKKSVHSKDAGNQPSGSSTSPSSPTPGSLSTNGKSQNVSTDSNIGKQLKAPKMNTSSSSTSSIHPVDSHSSAPHLKLARFLEKRHQKHTDDIHNLHKALHNHHLNEKEREKEKENQNGNGNGNGTDNGASKEHVHKLKNSLTKPIDSKFDNFNALTKLVSKYGIIPDNSVDLMKLLNYSQDTPDDEKLQLSQAKSADSALIIGKGAGGSVYPLYDVKDHHLYALKKIRLQSERENWTTYEKKLKNEFLIASKLHNQNLIRTYDLLQDNDLFIIIMDYAPFDFFTMVMTGNMDKREIYCYFKQMCKGVSYMHSIGLAHRDLKLDNCVVDKNGILKIVDFGSSVIFDFGLYYNKGKSADIEKASGIMGSDPYLAPEIVQYPYYDPSLADVWSLAIIYCCIVLQRFPWRIPKHSDNSFDYFTRKPSEITDKNGNKKLMGPDRLLRLLPTASREVIGNMLKIEPNHRFKIEQVLETDFLKSIDECHYDNYDSNKNKGTLVKNDNHQHHLITNKQFEEANNEEPDKGEGKEKEKEKVKNGKQ